MTYNVMGSLLFCFQQWIC